MGPKTLQLKVGLYLAIALTLALLLFTALVVRQQREQLLRDATSRVTQLSEMITRSTRFAMLQNRPDYVHRIIADVGSHRSIDRIRIFSKEGRIIDSTRATEIGLTVDQRAEGCVRCHESAEPLEQVSGRDKARLFTAPDGRRLLGSMEVIRNEPSCHTASCHFHRADQSVLGVLDIVYSLEDIDRSLRRDVIVIAVLAVGFGLIAFLAIQFLVRRFVYLPLRDLEAGAKRLAAGNLEQPIPVRSGDELGQLADSFNAMTGALRTSQEQLREWARTLEEKVARRTRELRKAEAEAARGEKLASVGLLAAGIAHELNNPLTGIVLHASIIEENQDLPPRVKEEIGTITWEADRCARIVKNLLDFSRKTEPRKGMNSVNETLDRALGLVEHLASFHNIDIVREYADNLPDLLIDPGQMEQVFVNMFVNASQAMEDGGKLILWTGLDVDGESVIVRIKDTGRGIPKGHLGRIFDPFFSTKGAKGTGLGLSVSYGIIEGHGGTIEVQSEVGKGTEFTITIPV